MPDHTTTVSAAADAILAVSRWAAAGRKGKLPRTADAILTEYAGDDHALYDALADEAIQEAGRRGYQPQRRGHRGKAAA